MHTTYADGSDRERCTIQITGLGHPFEPPLPDLDCNSDLPHYANHTTEPDDAVMTAMSRKEDREALEDGEDAMVVASKRPRPKRDGVSASPKKKSKVEIKEENGEFKVLCPRE